MIVSENEGEVYDLIDYQFAREVMRTHPRIISIYDKLLPALYQFAAYQAVFPVIQMVEENKLLAEQQYRFYKKIYDIKGKK